MNRLLQVEFLALISSFGLRVACCALRVTGRELRGSGYESLELMDIELG